MIPDDRLMALAFGDLDGPEAARLEAEVARDPDAASRLASFRALRTDLRRLSAVPECQLSPERLRDEILRREMGDRRRRPLGWTWGLASAPVAAAALWFGLQSLTPPVPVERPGALAVAPRDAGPEAAFRTHASPPAAGPAMTGGTAPASDVRVASASANATSDVRGRRASRPSGFERPGPRVMLASRGGSDVAPAPAAEATMMAAMGTAADAAAGWVADAAADGEVGLRSIDAPPSAEPTADESIVIIRRDTDAATGARAASEVDADEPIVFGG